MKYSKLGLTDISVSQLCFGVLPMGPLQAKLSPEEGGALIRQSLEEGINFLDTAELYGTYEHILKGIKGFSGEVIITSKSSAADYKGMEASIQGALKALDRDVIDIFHLHAARANKEVFKQREGALQCILDYKEKGYIRAAGVATHDVEVVELAAAMSEIDVIHPLINKSARGILNGTAEDMIKAIEKCALAGKGLYAMKALAGGGLIEELFEAFSFVRNIKGMHSVAVGMINEEELKLNLKIFNDEIVDPEMLPVLKNTKKILVKDFLCKKCGICIKACPNGALKVSDKAVDVDHDKCILCAYCYPVCPEFAIRMI